MTTLLYDGICAGCAWPVPRGEGVRTRPGGRWFHARCLRQGLGYADEERALALQLERDLDDLEEKNLCMYANILW